MVSVEIFSSVADRHKFLIFILETMTVLSTLNLFSCYSCGDNPWVNYY